MNQRCIADWDSTRPETLLNTLYHHESAVGAKYIIALKIEFACNFTEAHQLTTFGRASSYSPAPVLFARLLSGYADCHPRAEGLIFREESTTEADKATKRCVIFWHFIQNICPCQSLIGLVIKDAQTFFFFIIFEFLKMFFLPFMSFKCVIYTWWKTVENICKSSSPSST